MSDKLQEALTNMLNAQAAMLSQQVELSARQSNIEHQFLELKKESDKRWSVILNKFNELTSYLEKLPGAVKEQIGFQSNG